MKHKLLEFRSKDFTLGKRCELTVLLNEASSMFNRHLQPLYNDACDIGFAVKSETTGNVVVYYMTEVVKDGTGEVVAWDYMPTPDSIKKYPLCATTVARVFND
jgi:hypothetical protein